ncbi:MAG: phosphoribosylglycinamide formyltransferase [Cyclobacteriaceae bacterium]
MLKTRIAIFASGSGSNAENFFKYFQSSKDIEISLVLTNNPKAYVLERAKNHNVERGVFSKNELNNTDTVISFLKKKQIDVIVLAGFLLLIPKKMIDAFPERIINIHPALLPKYGGKGMYGLNVHEAVKSNKETESGITIHLVNQIYDDGKILFQKSTAVSPIDTPEDIANKIHQLEYQYFPSVVEEYIQKVS